MESHKCTECGLMNWAEAERCKRCQIPLRKLNGQLKVKSERAVLDAPRLFTFNGIGSRLLGWKHYEDGTATATVWFSVLWLPIFPISRQRLVSPTYQDLNQKISRGWQFFFVLNHMAVFRSSYTFLGRLPLEGGEVLWTYLFSYILLPMILL